MMTLMIDPRILTRIKKDKELICGECWLNDNAPHSELDSFHYQLFCRITGRPIMSCIENNNRDVLCPAVEVDGKDGDK